MATKKMLAHRFRCNQRNFWYWLQNYYGNDDDLDSVINEDDICQDTDSGKWLI